MARLLLLVLSLLVALPGALSAAQWAIVDPGQGAVLLPAAGTGAAELSGITWAGDSQFYVVGDNAAAVFPLAIALDPVSGAIVEAQLAAGIALAAGADLEGLAYVAGAESVVASDEAGVVIREHALVDGALLGTLAVPAVFAAYRPNLSLESLSRSPDGDALWTANEEALSVDGALSSSIAGTAVRLQRFDGALAPAGQWAYVTDPYAGDIGAPGRDLEVSGVVDLAALPDGRLLVMERALGVGLFRHRIYEVEVAAATDVSALPALDGASFTPAAKTLLWESFGALNFEGMSLGPPLADQAQSLLLVSDSGGGLGQALRALTLVPAPPCAAAPLAGCAAPGAAALTVASRGGTRDALVWTWRRGMLPDASAFGEPPVGGGNGFALCLYDAVAGVPRLRLAAPVPRGGAWRAVRATGFAYADPHGAAAGVTAIRLRAGSGNALVKVRARGATLGLPPPPASGTLLARDPAVTVQFVDRDAPARCVSASFSAARRDRDDHFRARF